MARQSTLPLDQPQPEYEEEDVVSGAGEGDEVMEEAEQDEGYSVFHYSSLSLSRSSF